MEARIARCICVITELGNESRKDRIKELNADRRCGGAAVLNQLFPGLFFAVFAADLGS